MEYRNGTKKNSTSTSLHKDDDSSSQSSLGSNMSRSQSRSRQNSKGSLLDMMEGTRRPSAQTNYSGTGNLNVDYSTGF